MVGRLEEAGVPKGDIVLGFHLPNVWPYNEYAVVCGPAHCRKRGAPTGTTAWRSFQKSAPRPPDQCAVDRPQIVERDRAINREFEQSRAAARVQKLKPASPRIFT